MSILTPSKSVVFFREENHNPQYLEPHEPNDVKTWKINRIKKRLLRMGYRSSFQTYELKRVQISSEDIHNLLFRYKADVEALTRSKTCILVIGHLQYEELTQHACAPQMMSFSAPVDYRLMNMSEEVRHEIKVLGLHVKVLPHFDGVLIVPLDGGEHSQCTETSVYRR